MVVLLSQFVNLQLVIINNMNNEKGFGIIFLIFIIFSAMFVAVVSLGLYIKSDKQMLKLNEDLENCDIEIECEQPEISTSTLECEECFCEEIADTECENELYYCYQQSNKKITIEEYDIIRLERDSLKTEKQKLLEENRNLLQKTTDLMNLSN